jgi:hypothetical protein
MDSYWGRIQKAWRKFCPPSPSHKNEEEKGEHEIKTKLSLRLIKYNDLQRYGAVEVQFPNSEPGH